MKPLSPPPPSNESQRLQALRDYHILDTKAEAAYDNLAELASYICDVPMATITFVDQDRQWFKARLGVSQSETRRDISFCTHTILGLEPLIVQDAFLDPRFTKSVLVREEPGIRFYAGFPLTTTEGYGLGALCAIDRRPRDLDDRQKKAMAALARQVMTLLELRRVTAKLAEALEKVKHLEGLLPICAWCKRIRDDHGAWTVVEKYISRHTSADFTHSICPECIEKVQESP